MLAKRKNKGGKVASRSKRKNFLAKAGGKVGGKLPRSKLKLSYLAVLTVFVIAIFGYVGLHLYEHQSIRNDVAKANWTEIHVSGMGILVCKTFLPNTPYGPLHKVTFLTFKERSWARSLEFTVYRPTGVPGHSNALPKYSTGLWWDGVANRTDIYLSWIYNDSMTYRILDGTGTGIYNRTFGIGDMVFC